LLASLVIVFGKFSILYNIEVIPLFKSFVALPLLS